MWKNVWLMIALVLLVFAAACSSDSDSSTDPGDVFEKAELAMEFVNASTGRPIENPSYDASVDTGVSSRQGPLPINGNGRTDRVNLSVPDAWADQRNPQNAEVYFFLRKGEVCKGGLVAKDKCFIERNGPVEFKWVDSPFQGGHWLGVMTVAEIVPGSVEERAQADGTVGWWRK